MTDAGALEDGEAIAVRATDGHTVTAVSGTVDLHDTRHGEATIQGGHLWQWHCRTDEPVRRRRIADLDHGEPQKQESYRHRPRLDQDGDGQFNLIVFAPTYDGPGLRYYAPHLAGEVAELQTGPIVAPNKLLTDVLDERGVVK